MHRYPDSSVESLSNTDLLGVLVGHRQASSLLRESSGSLHRLLNEPSIQTYRLDHRPAVRASSRLKAAAELVRRSLAETLQSLDAMTSPAAVRTYLRVKLVGREHEVFVAMFLDTHNRVIGTEELFRGSLTQTSVYPREVVKRALAHNAAGVILAHNHPAGLVEPSRSDELLTQTLKQALAMVDVRVLDHVIVGGNSALSFAEKGLL